MLSLCGLIHHHSTLIIYTLHPFEHRTNEVMQSEVDFSLV